MEVPQWGIQIHAFQTLLSCFQDFASKCHISHLIDKRFQGMAVGVGQSKIIGKVHQVRVLDLSPMCSFPYSKAYMHIYCVIAPV